MSAHAYIIKDYLDDMLRGFDAGNRADRILSNYEAALRETAQYHRWFIDLRDGRGGWAEEMAELRAKYEAQDAVSFERAERAERAEAEVERLRAQLAAAETNYNALAGTAIQQAKELDATREDGRRWQESFAQHTKEEARLREENERLRGECETASNDRLENERLRKQNDEYDERWRANQAEVERLRTKVEMMAASALANESQFH